MVFHDVRGFFRDQGLIQDLVFITGFGVISSFRGNFMVWWVLHGVVGISGFRD